jgi:hypothetical protein
MILKRRFLRAEELRKKEGNLMGFRGKNSNHHPKAVVLIWRDAGGFNGLPIWTSKETTGFMGLGG